MFSLTSPKRSFRTACRPLFHWTGICSIAFVLGCSGNSDDPVRYPITGNVTFGGAPIPIGEIFLQPDSDAGNSGPASNSDIHDSKYSLPKEFGVLGGPYIVRITGYSNSSENSAGPLTLRGAPMFKDYSTKVDIPRDKKIEQNFDVPNPKKTPAK
ncbi:hypothetical protein [Planctomicrobium sp. SH527]|uniref:hypothetical protein n=1 Tax=Planctomicrobium sp. SH527 TaxID=3448123 RepID=UPI003F5B0FF9